MNDIKKYNVKAQDWRTALHKNNRKTINVIILFILIYIFIGFILDLYLNFAHDANINTPLPLNVILQQLLTFKIIPFATLFMLVIAGISLLIAYYFHKSLIMLGTNYHEVTSDSQEIDERRLFNVVEELKIAAGMKFMPKVYIIDAEYMNAFASGYSEKSAMVAITKGLMQKLDRDELQAVMAHELSHIRNNDIRILLIVTLLSNLILIAIDLLFRWVLYGSSISTNKKDNRNKVILIAIITIARILLPIITILLMLYLSRTREFMADAGCVELTRSNEPLARALLKIDADYKDNAKTYQKEFSNTQNENLREASYLYSPKDAGISSFKSLNDIFSTHPPLEERLRALGVEAKQTKE